MSENGVVLPEDMTELSWALSKIANDMVWQSKPKWEMRAWADMTIATLPPEVQKLVSSTIYRSTNDNKSEVTGWGWKWEQKSILDKAITPYLPKV